MHSDDGFRFCGLTRASFTTSDRTLRSLFPEAGITRTTMLQPAKKALLSLEENARIIAQAEAGKKKALIAEEIGIAASSLSTILKSKDATGKALASGTSAKHKKFTEPVHEALDKTVYT